MSFACIGASRSGKSTLCREIEQHSGILYHDAGTTRIMKQGGFNAVSSMSVEQRIDAQEYLLGRYLEEIALLPRPFITDRTPLDFAAYMLSEVAMHGTDPEVGKRIAAYAQSCISATQSNFDTLIILRPLPFYEVLDDKPPPNLAYQLHVQTVIEGLASYARGYCSIAYLHSTDLEERTFHASGFLKDRLKSHSEEMTGITIN